MVPRLRNQANSVGSANNKECKVQLNLGGMQEADGGLNGVCAILELLGVLSVRCDNEHVIEVMGGYIKLWV